MNKVAEKVKNKIKSLQKLKQICNTSTVLQDEEVKQYLQDLQTKFCIVPINKALNNFPFIYKKFYVSKLLDEIGLRATQNDAYKLANKLKEEVIDDSINFSSNFGLEAQNDFKALPIMEWLPKMHKIPTGVKMHQKSFVKGSY